MAETIPWDFLAINASGDLGAFTCYTDRFGKKIWYPKTPPETPETPGQRQQRDRFAAAVANWKEAEQATREAYEAVSLAASLMMTGHNLWVSLSFSQDDQARVTLVRQTGIEIPLPPALPYPPAQATKTPAPVDGRSKPTVRF